MMLLVMMQNANDGVLEAQVLYGSFPGHRAGRPSYWKKKRWTF